MVFFTCNGCGESVKKAQVEKHFNICRSCSCLSCIDCGKDFRGNDYKSHTKCITEDQKYGGKGFEAKAKKGDVKQQQWIQKIHEAMKDSKVSPRVREILELISSSENIPQKKAKFQNWMKNSLRIKNEALQEQVWEIFAAAVSKDKNSQQQNQKHIRNGKGPSELVEANSDQVPVAENNEKIKNKWERKERKNKSKKQKKHLEDENCLDHKPDHKTNQLEEKQKKKSKKRHNRGEAHAVEENGTDIQGIQQQDGENLHSNMKCRKRKHAKSSSEGEPKSKEKKVEITETKEVEENDETKPGKFNWKKTIKMVLRQSPEQEISIKKLRKKVLSQYYTEIGDSNYKSEEELQATFIKKINCNPKFKVLKDKVKLLK
ncbi:cell growth-regulating nucleolar protein [Pristis pectinata]|uniref:cell growth-regulating nucleolar protein n=1 Tax=Pristis pectinata TaxID=685728 RepID=UPI00223D98E5|nr:cell growth-regulating nucleolar protein [Pristis pectinata]XP_051866263.1 cell growth-regulating nucleolar protein [Pristis pectinata]